VVSYSTNGGNNWTRCNLSPTTQGYAYTLAIAPSATNKIYAGGRVGTAGKVFVSTDYGVNWNSTTTAPNDIVYCLMVHPTDENIVYAATSGGLYQTTNGGNIWTNQGASPELRAVRLFPEFPDTILVGGDSGVFISFNGGNDWNSLNTGLDGRKVNCLDFAITDEIRLFAGTNGGATYLYTFETGIENEPESILTFNNFLLSPNPSLGNLKLQFNQSLKQPIQVKLWDISGRLVWQDRIKSSIKYLDLPDIQPGVYQLELISGQDKAYTKIVITR
jgi:hypothetical protein